ncbi:MAG TPA: c-type cytochrome [Agriterribacter sp.]|nr:c-type cytochrome [Chitinophagaceae bacterium]HRP31361.1 c-type cytochrome [Agriterribacter sp.]
MSQFKKIGWIALGAGCVATAIYFSRNAEMPSVERVNMMDSIAATQYLPPDTSLLAHAPQAALIRYGRSLVTNTRKLLGPEGEVAQISNRLNCQSCHLEGGAKATPYSANFLGVAANYPLFRERSGNWETIQYRINDCMVRSMNGKPLDTAGQEMKALVAYILWVGKDVPSKTKPISATIEQLPYLQRAADTLKGKAVFIAKCQLCHGVNGSGGYSVDSTLYYPPLWGPGSYNTAAGMYRLSRLAGFVKNNMPFGVSHGKSQLSDEECWDVAAYINSRPRPHVDFPNDWPDISKKAIDHPFGPYSDSFSEQQHKYGPFEPIAIERKKKRH